MRVRLASAELSDAPKSAINPLRQSEALPVVTSLVPAWQAVRSSSQRFTHSRPVSVPVSGRVGLAMAQAVTNATSSNAVVR